MYRITVLLGMKGPGLCFIDCQTNLYQLLKPITYYLTYIGLDGPPTSKVDVDIIGISSL